MLLLGALVPEATPNGVPCSPVLGEAWGSSPNYAGKVQKLIQSLVLNIMLWRGISSFTGSEQAMKGTKWRGESSGVSRAMLRVVRAHDKAY